MKLPSTPRRSFFQVLGLMALVLFAMFGCQSPVIDTPATASSESISRATTGITVYTTGYTHIYFWNSTPAGSPANATWPGVAMTTDPVTGYKKYTFPNASAINLIFSNNGAGQTADLSRSTGTWLFSGGAWSAYPLAPTASASPGTSSFSTNSLAVTLTANNPGTGTYKIDNGTATSFTDGAVININGSDLAVGQSHTLTVANGTSSNTYTYTKSSAGIKVYTSGYTHVYFWSSTPLNSPANATWPGVAMTTDAASGLKTYSFPSATAINLIFSNNGSGQSADLVRTTGSWLFSGGNWTVYSETPTASATPGTSSFSTTTLAVTLQAANPATGTYAIDGAVPVSYTHGQVINIKGADLAAGQTRTLVVKNGTASNTYTYTKTAAPPVGIKVYTSGYTHIYFWSSTPVNSPANATWPGVAMATDPASGLKTYEFPNASGINIIFSNNGAGQTPDQSRTAGNWFYSAGTWTPYSTSPTATACPGSLSFSTSTLAVTLKATNPGSGTYKIDGAAPVGYTNGQVININGADLAVGQSHTLLLTNGTASNTYTYTKSNAAVFPDTLGALYTPTATKFRIWSPSSSNVSVTVNGTSYPCTLVPDFAGYSQVYEATVPGDQKNKTYQFYVASVPVRDPYALMVSPGSTQGVVVDMPNILPTGGTWAARPSLNNREDSIVYEVHVRDFTIDPNSGVDSAKKGKFAGMVQTGTTYNGVKTGIDHLKELGVTHVQLLPVYDFGSGMYNWGYDPANYNVPEDQYSQASTPEARIREFKDMVNEYHKNGIRVIMDVVYNHTIDKGIFGGISGLYYTGVDLSGCGNSINDGVPMVSRMIRDSLDQWVENYNIDGFRFDLIGVFRYNEVKNWGEYLNGKYYDRNLLLYGEPWNGYASDPDDAVKVRMGKVPAMASGRVGVFNGKYREDIKGNNDGTTLAYMANGSISWWGAIAAGMRGSLVATKSTAILANDWDSMFAYDPEQTINYISAHDNYDLWDKIVHSGLTGGGTGYAGRVDKMGMGMVLTSQGIPFIHAGDEFLRSKVYNGDWTYAHNSYNAPDNYNMIRWADKLTNAGIHTYYKNAIALRKSLPGLRLTTWDEVKNRMVTKLNAGTNNAAGINAVNDASLPAKVVVSEIDNDGNTGNGPEVVVVFNPGNDFNVTLPPGTWTKIFDSNGTVSKTDAVSEGTSVTVFKKN